MIDLSGVPASREGGRSARPAGHIHGAVSTGAAWKFLRLRGEVVTMDGPEYFIDNLPKIMGILRTIAESG